MEKVLFYSTNRKSPEVSFREALIKGQAPDRGLYMPVQIPLLEEQVIQSFREKTYPEIAWTVIREFLKGEISDHDLLDIVKDAYNYPVPLELVTDRKFILRLDQGPTASFKDFAARMMGRLMQYYLSLEGRQLLILTATSGDTGSAVANAFYGLDQIKVVILYPKDEVTSRQRKQMTTLGKNITVLGLDAKFDDCQALVKQAFADPDLDYLNLSSANSINIGRLIPQSVYYFYAHAQLRESWPDPVIFSVPSGNFGDMMGGMFAHKMGLPIERFIIAVNENDEFPEFLKTGKYAKIVPSRNCISSAMNVGHPSNLARLVDLYGGQMDETGQINELPDMAKINDDMVAVSISDLQTRATIQTAWERHRLLLEPHGAVGWAGLWNYLKNFPDYELASRFCVSLETAHPAKFPQQINDLLGFDPELPDSLKGLEEKTEILVEISKEYEDFKGFLKRVF